MELSFIKETIEKKTNIYILKHCRQRQIVDVRKIFCYIARKHTKFTLHQIGSFIKRDHATILHNEKSAEILMQVEPEFREKLNKLEELVLKNYKNLAYVNKLKTPRVLHPGLLRYANKPLRKVLIKRR